MFGVCNNLTYPKPNFLTFGQYIKNGSTQKVSLFKLQGGTGEVF